MVDNLTAKQRQQTMRAVKSKNTTPERAVRSRLHAMGYRFRLQSTSLPGKPDIVLPRLRLVIFVHGCFWHAHTCARGRRVPQTNTAYWTQKIQRNAARDILHRAALKKLGWRVLTIWECRIAEEKFPIWLQGQLGRLPSADLPRQHS